MHSFTSCFFLSTLYLWDASIVICVTLIHLFSLFNIVRTCHSLFIQSFIFGYLIFLCTLLGLTCSYLLLILLWGCLSFLYWFLSILFLYFLGNYCLTNKYSLISILKKPHKTYHSFAFSVSLKLQTSVHIWKGKFSILSDWCEIHQWNCFSVNRALTVETNGFKLDLTVLHSWL